MSTWDVLVQGFWAFIATVGFAVLFNIPTRLVLVCGLTGAAGHICRRVLLNHGIHPATAAYCGAVVVGFVGYLEARFFQMPRLVFTVTGIIPMVPGVQAFETIVYFMRDDILTGVETTVRVILIVGAIGAGLTTARLTSDLATPSASQRRLHWTQHK
jgi:uncharacterized membrane protein YjjB (DUF3815 family)